MNTEQLMLFVAQEVSYQFLVIHFYVTMQNHQSNYTQVTEEHLRTVHHQIFLCLSKLCCPEKFVLNI